MTKLRVPAKAHPFVRALYREMLAQHAGVMEVSRRSGVCKDTLSRWRYSNTPDLENIQAALNAVGLELRVVRQREQEAGSGLRSAVMDLRRVISALEGAAAEGP